MILDMNIQLDGIDEEFLEEFDELIEDTRVEYFVINPTSKDELEQTKQLCNNNMRFKYTLPIEFKELGDKNFVAYKIKSKDDLKMIDDMPVVIDSKSLNNEFVNELNATDIKGVILFAKESDNVLTNFAYSVSRDSIKEWTNKGMMDTDYNRLALQSDYPKYTYDELLDGLLKDMSDMTFRAEQSIASGGTRTILKTFGLL